MALMALKAGIQEVVDEVLAQTKVELLARLQSICKPPADILESEPNPGPLVHETGAVTLTINSPGLNIKDDRLSPSMGFGPRICRLPAADEACATGDLEKGPGEPGHHLNIVDVATIPTEKLLNPEEIGHVQEAILQNRARRPSLRNGAVTQLRLHKAWKFEEDDSPMPTPVAAQAHHYMRNGSSMTALSEGSLRKQRSKGEEDAPLKWYDNFTISHKSPMCIIWDIWTSIAIGYDMVMTPMDAFDINVSENQVLRILERTSSITWLMDMILSFARTYGKLNGTEERHLRATSRNYLRTWFVFDFTLVCLDMFIFVIEDTTWVRYMSFFRIIRLFRLLRVLRLAKVKARIAVLAQLFHIMQTQHITDRGLLILNIAKSLLAVTVINHFTACTWYAVGTILNDDHNWVTAHFREPGEIPKPDSLLYLYTTAYHWSITQLTPASMEIYPQSARERIFNIAVILFGLCVFSSFISSMAQQLAALQQLSKVDRHKMQVLRRFISENKMSVALATTIVDFVRQRKSPLAQRPLKVSDIEIFATFPSVLLQKIRTEAHYFVLGKHSLFQCVYNNDRDTFSRVCNTCIVEQSVDRGHDVFKVGEKGAAMYVVNHGKLAYALGMDDLFDPTDSQEWLNLKENNLASIISSGTVVSEVAVWLDWVHRGRLYGEAVLTDLLCVDTDLFQEVMRKSVLLKDIRLYARLFALRAIRIGHQGYLDDLWYEEDTIREISFLALQGGLEATVSSLAGGRITTASVFKAWKAHTKGTFLKKPRTRLCAWLRFFVR